LFLQNKNHDYDVDSHTIAGRPELTPVASKTMQDKVDLFFK